MVMIPLLEANIQEFYVCKLHVNVKHKRCTEPPSSFLRNCVNPILKINS